MNKIWFFRTALVTALFMFIGKATDLSVLAGTIWSLLITIFSSFLGRPVYYAIGSIIVIVIAFLGKKHAQLIATFFSYLIVTVISFVLANGLITILNLN